MTLTEARKGQIALALLKLTMLREGIHLHPQNLRSKVGKAVQDLNELNPGLDLSFDEAVELFHEFVQFASDEAFKPSKKDLRLQTK